MYKHIYTCIEIDMHGHTRWPDRRLEEPSVSLVTEQLGRVIIICEL